VFIESLSPDPSAVGADRSPDAVATPRTAERRMVRVGCLDLQVDIRPGAAGRVPLLMFGGIGAGLDVLRPLVDAIDVAVPVIRVDVPGIGGSPATVPLPIPVLAGLMSELLSTLGHRQVDVLGYSWGGAVAQQFAVQHAARCRRLVLISTNIGAWSVPPEPSMLAKLLVPRRIGDATEAAQVDAHLHDDLRDDLSVAIAGAFGDAGSASPGWWGYLAQLGALMTWSSLPFLPFLIQPTLVIGGVDDPLVPVANARLLAAAIPRATLAVIPGGHFGIVHAADDLGARVSRFLA
jgi:pimeloyl-ACP methyl ester carboxylesterase